MDIEQKVGANLSGTQVDTQRRHQILKEIVEALALGGKSQAESILMQPRQKIDQQLRALLAALRKKL